MTKPPTTASLPIRWTALIAPVLLILAVVGCAVWANLSYLVTNPNDYRYFPPFERNVNANNNQHLGAEYFNIARSLQRGRGFSNPFGDQTGPTAWMPPVLPGLLASLLWACDGDKDAVMAVVIFLQVSVLVGTGLLVIALAGQTSRWAAAAAAVVYFGILLCHFHLCFQSTHDSWLVLLALDLLIVWACWGQPMRRRLTAPLWGLFGGFCALVNPMVALAWGVFSLVRGIRRRAWVAMGLALLAGGLTLVPWAIRNYLVLGRWVPVKSNLAYELYQSQCLQSDGLIQNKTFASHPYAAAGRERQEYKAAGEMVFLDHKREQFWQSVRADPLDFLDRVACRFLGTTLWYEPFDRVAEARRPWVLWSNRLAHPLPFLGFLVLIMTAPWKGLSRAQWVVLGAYLLYLFPYIAASYYERYGVPLVGVKALLVVWGGWRLVSLFIDKGGKGGRQAEVAPPARAGRRTRPMTVSR
jgi:hypothetical protein